MPVVEVPQTLAVVDDSSESGPPTPERIAPKSLKRKILDLDSLLASEEKSQINPIVDPSAESCRELSNFTKRPCLNDKPETN